MVMIFIGNLLEIMEKLFILCFGGGLFVLVSGRLFVAARTVLVVLDVLKIDINFDIDHENQQTETIRHQHNYIVGLIFLVK